MKKFKIQKVSGAIFAALMVISAIVFCLFFFGGETPEAERVVADTSMSEPAQTDTLLYWLYAMGILTILVTLCVVVFQFFATLKDSPKAALASLIPLILVIALLAVTYTIGDGTPLNILGYEGTENVPVWLKTADMFLYSVYAMMAVLVVLIVGFSVAKRFK